MQTKASLSSASRTEMPTRLPGPPHQMFQKPDPWPTGWPWPECSPRVSGEGDVPMGSGCSALNLSCHCPECGTPLGLFLEGSQGAGAHVFPPPEMGQWRSLGLKTPREQFGERIVGLGVRFLGSSPGPATSYLNLHFLIRKREATLALHSQGCRREKELEDSPGGKGRHGTHPLMALPGKTHL